MYRIFIAKEFDHRLDAITKRDRDSISRKLSDYIAPQIKLEPHYGPNIKKLKGYSPETWRYRTGRYRLFYLINETEKIVQFISIDDRKDAY